MVKGKKPLDYYINVIEALIECQGIDINYQNNSGQTALMIACGQDGELSSVKTLLSVPSIKVDIIDHNGENACHYAAFRSHGAFEVIEYLFTYVMQHYNYDGNDGSTSWVSIINHQCSYAGKTPYMLACQSIPARSFDENRKILEFWAKQCKS